MPIVFSTEERLLMYKRALSAHLERTPRTQIGICPMLRSASDYLIANNMDVPYFMHEFGLFAPDFSTWEGIMYTSTGNHVWFSSEYPDSRDIAYKDRIVCLEFCIAMCESAIEEGQL